MAAAYGIDVRDPRLSLPRFWTLFTNLPPSARRPGQEWSVEAELLALVADQLAMLTWVTMRANGAKGAPKPRPLPRPPTMRAAAARAAAARTRPVAPVPTGGWAAAARQLAAIPGVVIQEDG